LGRKYIQQLTRERDKEMTQAQQTADGFFSGGGKAVKFTTVGDSVTGIVAAVHQPEQQTTPGDNMPVFDKKTGAPKMQIRIELETDQRDPSDEWDDGRRTLYCRGWMKGAIGDALRRAGASGAPAIGGKLTVTFSAEEPNPGLSPTKKFTATYVPPSANGADGFFGGDPVTQQVPGTPPPAAPEPQRPPTIPEASWAAMPLATKQQVSASLADLPPF
jgi:hypothetical protein